jgi:arylsulfatase A-like enzyme
MVGALLGKLEELGIADNTIVVYSTDNGAEEVSWPDGGTSPFHGEKGTSWEGGHRVPQLIRWPGVIESGTRINQMMSHQDWMPTLLAAAGEPDVKEKLAEGHQAGDKKFRVHLDGYNFLPYLKGETETGPREEYLYFSQGGELNAVRWNDWKVHFAVQTGNIAFGTRDVTGCRPSSTCGPTPSSERRVSRACTSAGTGSRCGCSFPSSRSSRSSSRASWSTPTRWAAA